MMTWKIKKEKKNSLSSRPILLHASVRLFKDLKLDSAVVLPDPGLMDQYSNLFIFIVITFFFRKMTRWCKIPPDDGRGRAYDYSYNNQQFIKICHVLIQFSAYCFYCYRFFSPPPPPHYNFGASSLNAKRCFATSKWQTQKILMCYARRKHGVSDATIFRQILWFNFIFSELK